MNPLNLPPRPVFFEPGRRRKRPTDPCLCASCCKLDPGRTRIKKREKVAFREWLDGKPYAPRSVQP